MNCHIRLITAILLSILSCSISSQSLNSNYYSFFKNKKEYSKLIKKFKKTDRVTENSKGTILVRQQADEFVGEFFLNDEGSTRIVLKDKKGLLEPVYKLIFDGSGKRINIEPDWEQTRIIYDDLSASLNMVSFSTIKAYESKFKQARDNHWGKFIKEHEEWYRNYLDNSMNPENNTIGNAFKSSKEAFKDPLRENLKRGELNFHNSYFYDDVIEPTITNAESFDFIISPSIILLQQVVLDSYSYEYNHENDQEIMNEIMAKYNRDQVDDQGIEQSDEMAEHWNNMLFPPQDRLYILYRCLKDQASLEILDVEVFRNLKIGSKNLTDISILSCKSFRNSDMESFIAKDKDLRGISFGQGMKATGEGYKMAFKEMGKGFKKGFGKLLGKEEKDDEDTVNDDFREKNAKIDLLVQEQSEQINKFSKESVLTKMDVYKSNFNLFVSALKESEIVTGLKTKTLD